MSSPEEQEKAKTVHEGVQEFSKGLEVSLPLKHFSLYTDTARIEKVATFETNKALQSFRDKICKYKSQKTKDELEERFQQGIKNIIKDHESKHRNARKKSEAFLKELVDDILKYFKATSEGQILLAPEMDLKRVEKILETGKDMAIKYFDFNASYGYVDQYWGKKRHLEKKVDEMGAAFLEHQRRYLGMCEEEEELKKFKETLLGILRNIKPGPDKLKVSSRMLERKVKEFHQVLMEKHEKIYTKLFRIEVGESICPEKFIKWADGLTKEFDFENGLETASLILEQEAEVHRVKVEFTDGNTCPISEMEDESNPSDIGHSVNANINSNNCDTDIIAAQTALTTLIRKTVTNEAALNVINQLSTNVLNLISVLGKTRLGESVLEADEVQPSISAMKSQGQIRQCDLTDDTNGGSQNEDVNLHRTHQHLSDSVIEISTEKPHFSEEEDFRLRECCAGDLVPNLVFARSPSLDLEEESENSESPNGTLSLNRQKLSESQTDSGFHDSTDGAHLGKDSVQNQTAIAKAGLGTSEIMNVNGSVVMGAKRGRQEDLNEDACPPVSKKLRGMAESSNALREPESLCVSDFNVPDKNGRFPLLSHICNGGSFKSIQKMLDSGADVNIRTNERKYNAAHQVIWSLIKEKQSIKEALKILDLLVSKGFQLINGGSTRGATPLMLAMQYPGLNKDLVRWFHRNGADFNAVESELENSVLFLAIINRKSEALIQQILYYEGNTKHISKQRQNVLHMSAACAHESALKIFIDQVDVNERDIHGYTPLHLLFEEDDLDYHDCLKMILDKQPDFGVKDNEGYGPLASWIKDGKGNFFPALMNLKDQLPITREIASATLTVIVQEMERLKVFLPSSTQDSTQNKFVQFILFLIEEKRGTFRLKDESKWQLQKCKGLRNVSLTQNFCRELRTSAGLKWKGKPTQIKGTYIGKLELHTKAEKVGTIHIEIFLGCLLRSKNYLGFVEMCQCLKTYCVPVSLKT